MSRVLVISARDNVATALEALESGEVIDAGAGSRLSLVERIPRGHKVALTDIRAGAPVIKYGSPIGFASAFIAAGSHVHVHNVASARGRGDQVAAGAVHASRGAERLAEPPDPGDNGDT